MVAAPRMLRAAASRSRLAVAGACIGLAMLSCSAPAPAKDLGIEGQIYELLEEDFRVMLMRLMARHDWTERQEELKASARDYTKNLPAYFMPRAEETRTRWKDVGIVITEDIFLPHVDRETGSVFAPDEKLAVPAGTYLNPIAKMPSAGIERLFVFDATDPDQLAAAKELMKANIPQLSFMLIAGDLGPLAEEMNRPIYHPPPSMLEKFYVRAVPSMIGFGRGQHQGHMAVTEFKLPLDAKDVKRAWFGLPYPGYDPTALTDVPSPPDQLDTPAPSDVLENADKQSVLPGPSPAAIK
jgi:conjugal transfer pilus assembly protein TraW